MACNRRCEGQLVVACNRRCVGLVGVACNRRCDCLLGVAFNRLCEGLDIFVNCNCVNTRWHCYSTHNQYIEQHNNNKTTQITAYYNNHRKTIAQHNDNYFCRIQAVPRVVSLTLAFALQLRKKHGITSVSVVKECCYQLPKTPTQLQYPPYTHPQYYENPLTSIHYKTLTYTHPYITKLYKSTTVQF